MKLVVDRTLPISLRSQLQGLLEYGISCGELVQGEALPSVRDLAETLGVAPMTVAQVYADLKAAGLLETRPGSGTFVKGHLKEGVLPKGEMSGLYGQIDALLEQSRKLGIRTVDLLSLVESRAAQNTRSALQRRIVMVGLFADATESYARFIADRLDLSVVVDAMTIHALESDPQNRELANSADLVVTLVNKQQQVANLLPSANVIAIRFTPSEETRRALASLDSLDRILAISRFPEFLPILKSGVERFAPHVTTVVACTIETPELASVVAEATVVVYATGAEEAATDMSSAIKRIEYRHAPDLADIERVIVPALNTSSPR